uniref:Chromo domain-containing protein n=1 Tax=Hyaloperonospora arabidopsidis (strain Emoy2) TaxID=559515 RepID=M4C711_HYAAE
IDEFEGQPVREDVYTVQEIVDRRRKRDPTTRLKTYEYKVKWVGYDELTWEPAENLPHNLRRKFDRSYETRERKRS